MGSFVLASVWQAATARARLPEARPPRRRRCTSTRRTTSSTCPAPSTTCSPRPAATGCRLVLAHQDLAQIPRETAARPVRQRPQQGLLHLRPGGRPRRWPGTPCPNSTSTTWPTWTPTPPPPASSSTPAPPRVHPHHPPARSHRSTTPTPCGPSSPNEPQPSRPQSASQRRLAGAGSAHSAANRMRPAHPAVRPGVRPRVLPGVRTGVRLEPHPRTHPLPHPTAQLRRANGGTGRGPERPLRVSPAGTGRPWRTDAVLGLQARLTGRDETLLGWLADHHVLTTPQITRALFGSTGFAQRRLLTLHRAGLDRPVPATETRRRRLPLALRPGPPRCPARRRRPRPDPTTARRHSRPHPPDRHVPHPGPPPRRQRLLHRPRRPRPHSSGCAA